MQQKPHTATTIWLEEQDRKAIAAIREHYGVASDSDAIRLALRTMLRDIRRQSTPPLPQKYYEGVMMKLNSRILVLTLVALLFGSLLACGESSQATQSTASSPTVQATQAPAKPTVPPKWTTTHTFSGNGDKKTAIFTAPDDWKILYTCTYQNIGGVTADGALSVSVYGTDNVPIDQAVSATCKDGVAKTTGDTEEHQGGQVYLDINGTGDWTITVQELK